MFFFDYPLTKPSGIPPLLLLPRSFAGFYFIYVSWIFFAYDIYVFIYFFVIFSILHLYLVYFFPFNEIITFIHLFRFFFSFFLPFNVFYINNSVKFSSNHVYMVHYGLEKWKKKFIINKKFYCRNLFEKLFFKG